MKGFTSALFAPLSYAMVNVLDALLVKSHTAMTTLVMFSGLFGFVVASIAAIIAGAMGTIIMLPVGTVLLLMLAGVLELAWVYPYLSALSDDDADKVVIWFQTVPVFAYVMGVLVLGEVLHGRDMLIGLLVIAGAILMSLRFGQDGLRMNRLNVKRMLLASILIAIGTVLYKYAGLGDIPFWTSMVWLHVGLGMAALICFLSPRLRRTFRDDIRTSGPKLLGFNIANETFVALGNILVFSAVRWMPIALVFALGALQSVYVFLINTVLGRWIPDLRPEHGNRKEVIARMVGTVCVIVGVFLFARLGLAG